MRRRLLAVGVGLAAALGAGCSGGSGGDGGGRGGDGTLRIDGTEVALSDLSAYVELGEDPWYRIEGEPPGGEDAECVPGLSITFALYGDLPSSVRSPSDLAGATLPIEFTGDGDDANLCLAGAGNLLWAEGAQVTIESVDGDDVRFRVSGTFMRSDQSEDPPVPVEVSASGTAKLRAE